MTGPRLVVFDVDGTLIDSQRIILASMAEAFAGAGHPMPPEAEVLAIVGLSLPEAMAALAPHLPAADKAALVEGYRGGFVARRAAGGAEAHAPLYPGARAALERVAARSGTLLGVATGKARQQRRVQRRSGDVHAGFHHRRLHHVAPDPGTIGVAEYAFQEFGLHMREHIDRGAEFVADEPELQLAHPGGIDQRFRQMFRHFAVPVGEEV